MENERLWTTHLTKFTLNFVDDLWQSSQLAPALYNLKLDVQQAAIWRSFVHADLRARISGFKGAPGVCSHAVNPNCRKSHEVKYLKYQNYQPQVTSLEWIEYITWLMYKRRWSPMNGCPCNAATLCIDNYLNIDNYTVVWPVHGMRLCLLQEIAPSRACWTV